MMLYINQPIAPLPDILQWFPIALTMKSHFPTICWVPQEPSKPSSGALLLRLQAPLPSSLLCSSHRGLIPFLEQQAPCLFQAFTVASVQKVLCLDLSVVVFLLIIQGLNQLSPF